MTGVVGIIALVVVLLVLRLFSGRRALITTLWYAVGGIVTRPTLALVGEAGTEVVLPKNDPARSAQLLQEAGMGLA